MKCTKRLASRWIILPVVVAFVSLLLAPPVASQLTSPGNDAVYNSSGNVTLSPAFIDASVFVGSGQGSDICDVLYKIFNGVFFKNGYPSTGAVIDARGISGATNLTCHHGSPWTEGSTTVSLPSTILLPATGGATPTPIIIPNSSPWILPSNTHLIGEGDGIPSTGSTPGTTIQAAGSFSGSMIQFGSASVCSGPCTGISVENLTLDGGGQFVNGITNGFAQDVSTVDHVSLYQIRGTGLLIQGSANNSGPYSNITFDLGGTSGTSQTVCASINGPSRTRGLHGLTCISPDNVPPAAVLLDSSNNSIEDTRIVGFYDGIRVGANNDAQSNVLLNIVGDTLAFVGQTAPIVVVHISSNHNVSDLSIVGVYNANAGGDSGPTYAIQDDLTGAQLPEKSVGLYALGEVVSSAHSRYTTSPNAATWVTGPTAPGSSASCVPGSLFSCSGGSTSCTKNGIPYALWGCPGGTAVGWAPIR